MAIPGKVIHIGSQDYDGLILVYNQLEMTL